MNIQYLDFEQKIAELNMQTSVGDLNVPPLPDNFHESTVNTEYENIKAYLQKT